MHAQSLLVAASIALVTGTAFARVPECTTLDRAHWIPVEAMQQRLAARGHRVIDIRVIDGCYKAQLENARGQRFDAFYQPIEGHPLRRQVV